MSAPEPPFPSATWVWRRTKIRRPPEAQGPVTAKPWRFSGLPPRSGRESALISVKYRGGPEAWYEIKARGRTVRYPGWVCLSDLMQEINQSNTG